MVIVPHPVPLQPEPLRLQMTAVLLVFATVAVNCCLPPIGTVAVAGETVTPTGRLIVTDAVADLVGSATDVAVTKTCAGLGTAFGAVYKPPLVMVPHPDPLQPLPATLQVTAAFVVFKTVALNCCMASVTSWTVFGDMVTVTGGTTVTVAFADLVGSATEVTVTVTCAGVGTL